MPPRADLLLHNGTRPVGVDLEFATDHAQWSYSMSFPIDIPPAPEPGLQPLVVVDVQVLDGRVGVGILDRELQHFVTPEVDVAMGRPTRVDLRPDNPDRNFQVMVRNTASGGASSRFRLRGATLRFTVPDRRLLRPVAAPETPVEIHAKPRLSRTVDVLITHSSRIWNADECDRGYLQRRYGRPGRLDSPPPFDSLPPNTAPYHGLLSVFRLELSPAGVTSQVLRHYVSPEKVVHAAVMGDHMVVCFDAGIAVFARSSETPWVDVVLDSEQRVIDPWFGGLHTVVPVDSRICLVSSAGADAILWLDVTRRQVIRRWRLPASRYGTNYALDETSWLSEHYIPNDLQLGHLNCAAPDGRGGAFFSVLGQGDVGHVDASGNSDVLVSGYVGCHGVRFDGDQLYFSDSCRGRLMRVNGPDRATVLFDTGSRWLHDAVHLGDGLFLLTLGDRNRLVLADVERGAVLAEWDFGEAQGTVQFLSVASGGPTETPGDSGPAVTRSAFSDLFDRIRRRNVAAEPRPKGGGVDSFDTEAALELNEARLAHLTSLDLPIDGRTVLEVGAGVGRLTDFFLNRGCSVVVTEAREENVAELRRRLPTVDARQADVEEDLQHLGRFDVVFCYGVLYHLESPLRALRNMAAVCDDLLLIETMVCDARAPVLRVDDETKAVNQALRGLAHRPSPSYLALALNRIGFEHVYAATDPPDHPDYRFSWLDNMDTARDGALLRGVFVASRSPLEAPGLTSVLD